MDPWSPRKPDPSAGYRVGWMGDTSLTDRRIEIATGLFEAWSSGDADAVNEQYGATGLFQHLPSYWEERSAQAGVTGEISNPEASAQVASWLVYNKGGWRHWSASASCWQR